jgi:hypothetical protein
VSLPEPSLAHVARLTDETGILEHALGTVPRRGHGWCTDDQGRALALVSRVCDDPLAARLAETYLAFLLHAHQGAGVFRLRMGYDRSWDAAVHSDDADARAIFGLAVAAAGGPEHLRWGAREILEEALAFRSVHPRAMAHAAVGAAELVAAGLDLPAARSLLEAARSALPRPRPEDRGWAWPAPRLTYANALLPEGLIAVGEALGDREALRDGLASLRWLVRNETFGDRLSLTPVGGRGPGDIRPGFDQQPIEAASMAEACARAFEATRDPAWLEPLELAAAWCLGRNDIGVPLLDQDTGGGFDGLTPQGVNRNEGAESTLSVVAVLQLARRHLPPDVVDRLAPLPAPQREDASLARR